MCDMVLSDQEQLRRISELNSQEKGLRKPLTVRADVEVAHNYSSQALNSTEIAREKLRQMLAKVGWTVDTFLESNKPFFFYVETSFKE